MIKKNYSSKCDANDDGIIDVSFQGLFRDDSMTVTAVLKLVGQHNQKKTRKLTITCS